MYQRAMNYTISLCFLFAAGSASAEEFTTRSYKLPGHGIIQLQVPQSWRDEVQQPSDGHPPTITFRPKAGSSFQIQLTPLYSMRHGITMPLSADLREVIERSARSAQSVAVGKRIPVRKVQSASAAGYYFSATESAAKVGEYRYITQGMVRVGKVAPIFTVLSTDNDKEVVADTLVMLRSARHIPETASASR